MFGEVVCPDPAYEQLKSSGVADLILENRITIGHDLLMNSLDFGIIDYAREKLKKNRFDCGNEKSIMHEDLVKFEGDYESVEGIISFRNYENLLAKNPVYLGYLALEKNLLKYKEFGFDNIRSLEEAVTSFCLGEKHEFRSSFDEHVWRNGGNKNEIQRNVHGDLMVSQMDCSGRDYRDRTLFGDVRVFDCMKKRDGLGFGAHQEWSEFLTSLLQYSRKVGMEGIVEIVDWEGTLEDIGARGGNWGEGFNRRNAKSGANFYFARQFMCDNEKIESYPLTISNQNSDTIPFFKDGELVYFRESSDGAVEFGGRYFKGKKFLKVVQYGPEDLPHAIRGCLKYFARSREMIPAIMDEFKRK